MVKGFEHKFPMVTQGNLQSTMFSLPLRGVYMKPRVNQIRRNLWLRVKNGTEAINRNIYPDVKQEGRRNTGGNKNHETHERKATTSLSSHGFALPKSSRTYTNPQKSKKILN